MPAIYAHYRFGKLILPKLPADVRGAIQRHRSLFDAGLQGPDFLFYYKPATKNSVSALARTFHYQTGGAFFAAACRNLYSNAGEPEQAYLYGLLGHYCLDALCHPYIGTQARTGTVSHNAIESEFERFLLELDGIKRPQSYPRSRLVKLTKEDCRIVSKFYPGVTPEQVREATATMARSTGLMTCGNPIHRAAARVVLRTLGSERPGLLIPPKADPAHAGRNEALLACFTQALAQYLLLLEQIRDHITFREPFGTEFDRIFG